jgi:hypothetical protein
MNQEQRQQKAAEKWLGPNTTHGKLYDVVKMLESLIGCQDPEILQRAMRVARHALVPIQCELQNEAHKRYYREAYAVKRKQIRTVDVKSKLRDVDF